jgi:hypothetical protein
MHSTKAIFMNEMQLYYGDTNFPAKVCGSGYPLPFLNCANGTLLPLTLGDPFASMKSRLGKFFTTLP